MACEEARAGIDRLNLAACLLLGHVRARLQREGAIKEMIDGDEESYMSADAIKM